MLKSLSCIDFKIRCDYPVYEGDRNYLKIKIPQQYRQLDEYQDMLLRIETDEDLKKNFDVAIARVTKILLSIPSNQTELHNELCKLFNDNTANLKNKRQTIEAILTIIKSKPFWEDEIKIASKKDLPEEYLLSPQEYRDNLMLNIAKFYANKCEYSSEANQKHHICQWIKYFHNFCL